MNNTPHPIRIGVSTNFMHADPTRALFKGKTLQYVEERMALSIHRAQALPVILTDLKDDDATRFVMQQLDGLVLTGGADVSPRSYGEEPMRQAWEGDKIRDDYERKLIELALKMGLPVLGLCRGIQILNVALGGTLYQDIETQVPGALTHRDWENYDELGHAIRMTDGSWTAQVTASPGAAAEVNSIHHQGLKDVASVLTATAWAPDGIVEAVECIDDSQWMVGLQWHPEWLESEHVAAGGRAQGRADGGRVFSMFANVCRARRQ